MIVRRIQSRGRTMMPPEICEALGVKAGDTLSYAIEGDKVVLTRDASSDDAHGPDTISDEAMDPIIDQALADNSCTFSAGEVFGGIRARLEERRGRMDAA